MADFVTPEGRLSFPNLYEAKAAQTGAEPKYSCTVLVPKDAPGVAEWIARLQQGVQARIAEKWPNPDKRPKSFKFGIKDGDKAMFESGENSGSLKKDKYPEMAGCWVIQATGKNKPTVVDTAGNPVFDAGQIKAGYWVRMSFNLFAYSNVNVGVGCGLQNVLLVRQDEPFGSQSRAEDDFSAFFEAANGGAATPSSVKPETDAGMFA